MDLNAWVVVNFARVDENFQTVTVTEFRYRFFFILISISIKVLLILQTKFQLNIPSNYGENGDFNSFLVTAAILNSRPN